jgi:NTP pyrophosphatase (non-canonical NTP hydrolase)
MSPHRNAVDIAAATAQEAQAGPEHRRFKALLAKIESARARLAAWQEQAPVFSKAHADRVQPEIDGLLKQRRAWALELSHIALGPAWSKAERKALAEHLADLCGALLDGGDPQDAEIKALYKRFGGSDIEEEEAQRVAAMKRLMETMSGVDLGSEPAESMDELWRRAQAEAQRRHAAGAQGAEAEEGGGAPHLGSARPGGAARARKPKAKTAAQRRAEEEAQRVTQNVREVYRKLAAALHPDRTAADATPEERQQRVALMQRANAAYEAGDLLALLGLQLQIEQVDIAHAAGVAAAQVKHFNKVLAEQLREIEADIDERQMALCTSYGYMPDRRLDPARLGTLLQQELRELAAAQADLRREQQALRGGPVAARRWLKQQRAQQRLEAEMADLLGNPFERAIDEALYTMMRGGKGGRR